MKPAKILLIGGSGRSGTTVLSRILSMHPDLSNVPESRYLVDPDGIVDFYSSINNWSPYCYDHKVKRLESLLYDVAKDTLTRTAASYAAHFLSFMPWKLRPRYWHVRLSDYCPEFRNHVIELIDSLTDFRYQGTWLGMPFMSKKALLYKGPCSQAEIGKSLRQFLLKTFGRICERQCVSHYFEKNTWNHIWFDRILELLPEAKIVHIYRDPRDVVSSYCNQIWMPSDPVQSARVLRDLIKRWEEIKRRIPSKTYHEISLETLVEQPKDTLQGICDFYEIPWNDALMEINLSKSNTGRWKAHFSSEEAREVERILGDDIVRLGYE
ncbi:MAG: hypothetical protein GF344_20320 [Chitinivibrionales bacterium]|nr:hypothetical protein [Chitinivibrionales bacterium]